MNKRFLTKMMLVTVMMTLLPLHSAFAYQNRELHWSYNPNKRNEPVTTEPNFELLLEKYGGFYIGNTDKKEVYLTFDNGYENGYTKKVLDVLKEKAVPGAFFITGHYIKTEPELVKRMVDEGHIVGNHSWHHPSLVAVDDARLKEELEKVKQAYKELTGKDDMVYLRPPRGVFSERTLAMSQQLGYTNVFWSLAYKDWEVNNQKGWKYAYDQIMKRIHPGAVMLIHSVSSDNAEALGTVIDEMKKQGYEFKSLDDYVLSQQLPDLP